MGRGRWRLRGAAVGILVGASLALAGRPLNVDDADPVAPGQFEIEVGGAFDRDAGDRNGELVFGWTYGVWPGLEAGVGASARRGRWEETDETSGTSAAREESGFGDITLGLKWRVIESCPLGARHALALSLKLPTAEESKGLGSGKTDYDATWIASRALSDKLNAHLNVGYAWIGGPDADALHYGAALDFQFTETVQGVVEVFAERETAGGAKTAAQIQIGFRWAVTESLTLDAAAGTKIRGGAPDFTATAGLTWAFGFGEKGR